MRLQLVIGCIRKMDVSVMFSHVRDCVCCCSGVVPTYVPWALRGSGRVVDVLQACCGNAYRRGWFSDLNLLSEPHKDCFTTDDIWIAGYLATKAKVKRVIVGGEQTTVETV